DQVDHGQVDLDEVGEVAELEVAAQRLVVAGHDAGVALGQLGDDARRDGADVVDVQLGLGQALDEVTHRRMVPPAPGDGLIHRPSSSAQVASRRSSVRRSAAPKCSSSRCSDRKSTRLNSSHVKISYAVFCLKKKKTAVE